MLKEALNDETLASLRAAPTFFVISKKTLITKKSGLNVNVNGDKSLP